MPIPVKVPVHMPTTPYPYRHKPTQTHYKPTAFYSPIPGMAKHAYNSPDPKTSTFKSSHGINQFYAPFYSPAHNVSNAYTPMPYGKTPNPYSRASNLMSNPFHVSSPTIKTPPYHAAAAAAAANTSHILKEMQKQMPSYIQKQFHEEMMRQAAAAAATNGTGMFNMDSLSKMYSFMAGNNNIGSTQSRPSNVPAVVPNPPAAAQNQSSYEPAYSNRYPVDAKRDSKQENTSAPGSVNASAPPSTQIAPISAKPPSPPQQTANQPQTSTFKEEVLPFKELTNQNKPIEESRLFREPAYTELFQKISESNKLNEDIRSKIDYLYQSSMPKQTKGVLKKSLTISPIVNQLEGYESLDACTEKVYKSHELIIDNSNRNISMINDTIKDINHKIKKLKRSSRTRS